MVLETLLLNFLSSLISYFALVHFVLFELKPTQKLFIMLVNFLTVNFITYPLGQFTTPVILIIMFTLILSFTNERKLNFCCMLFGYLSTVIIDYVLSNSLYSLIGITVGSFRSELKLNLPYLVSEALIVYLVTKLLGNLLRNKFQDLNLLLSNKLISLILTNLLVCTGIFIFNFSYGETVGYPPQLVAYNGLLFSGYFLITILILIAVIKTMIEESETKAKLMHYKNLQEYTDKLEILYNDMRTFRHDYLNILSTMSDYINSHDIEHLEHYYNEQVLPFNSTMKDTDHKLNSLIHIKLSEVKSLLSLKILSSYSKNLKVTLEIFEDIEHVSMYTLDLSRLLGIYLDNAIEAAEETEDKIINITIIKIDDENPSKNTENTETADKTVLQRALEKDRLLSRLHFKNRPKPVNESENKNRVIFVIQNSCLAESVPFGKINSFGYSSKGPHRGVGLFSAAKIISKYPNIVSETCLSNHLFTQHLEIYEEESYVANLPL